MKKRIAIILVLFSVILCCPIFFSPVASAYGSASDNLKAQRELVIEFARRMNIPNPENATADFVAGLPVIINGRPVPNELYTDEQRATIALARSVSSGMQPGPESGGQPGVGGSAPGGDWTGGVIGGGGSSYGGTWNLGSIAGYGLPRGTLYEIIDGIMTWLLSIVGVIGIIGFLIAGSMYILSSGNENLAGKAKTAMMNSIIGIIVALAGLVIIKAIYVMLSGLGYMM